MVQLPNKDVLGDMEFIEIALSIVWTFSQDDEAKFREGTKKHICFSLLKEAGPQGLSIANLMEKARESGASGDWANNETSRRVLQYV